LFLLPLLGIPVDPLGGFAHPVGKALPFAVVVLLDSAIFCAGQLRPLGLQLLTGALGGALTHLPAQKLSVAAGEARKETWCTSQGLWGAVLGVLATMALPYRAMLRRSEVIRTSIAVQQGARNSPQAMATTIVPPPLAPTLGP